MLTLLYFTLLYFTLLYLLTLLTYFTYLPVWKRRLGHSGSPKEKKQKKERSNLAS